MERTWNVVELRRRKNGRVSRRSRPIKAKTLRFGRRASCEVHLDDARVRLSQLRLEVRGQQIWAVDDDEVRPILLGDLLPAGPYEVRVIQIAPQEITVELELVRPLEDDYEALVRDSQLTLEAAGLSQRRWAWRAALAVGLLAVAMPPIAHWLDSGPTTMSSPPTGLASIASFWSSGDISQAHRSFGKDCANCHTTAFVQVADHSCLQCHANITHHADPTRFEDAGLHSRCASCHLEHNGPQMATAERQRDCTHCHDDPDHHLGDSELPAVSDFGLDHPELPTSTRVAEALHFPHIEHLSEEGTKGPDGTETLDCDDCHDFQPLGGTFAPVRMETHCARCHPIGFEEWAPDRTLPHVPPEEALAAAADFYRGAALDPSLIIDGQAPWQRRPGQTRPSDRSTDPGSWAVERIATTHTLGFGDSVCGDCHVILDDSALGWTIADVDLSVPRWSAVRFDHGSHQSPPCETCHRAETAHELGESGLLPELSDCRSCHGGAHDADRTASPCVTCHGYHRADQPGM